MLLITTIEMFPSLTDADLKYLAGLKNTDKVVVLSKEGATMPVNLFMTLSTLKCKFEIKEMDTKDLFQLGFTIGSLCAATNEKVTILSNRELVIDAKNVTLASSLTGVKATPQKVPAKASTAKAEATKVKKEASSSAAKAQPAKPQAAKTQTPKVQTEKAPKAPSKRKGKSLTDTLLAYPELKKYKKVIETSEEAIAQAILAASDAEIGLPFQLQLRGFSDEKDAIVAAIKKDFKKIQEQIAASQK